MTTDTRIESLETQVRTLKRMLFGVFGLVVVGGLLAATSMQGVPDVVKAKKIQIVNDDGKPVVVLGSEEHAGIVAVTSHKGGKVVVLRADEHAGIVDVAKHDGKTVVAIGADSEGGGFGVRNNDGKTVVGIAATKDNAGFVLRNNDGKPVVVIGVNDHESGEIKTLDGKGKTTSTNP